jgi:soluble lytic murein transglycosylase-like protein
VIEVEPDGTTVTYSGPARPSPEPLSQPAQVPNGVAAAALRTAATRHGIADALIAAVAWQESHWRQSAVSPKGARGLMQLMPTTAKILHVNAADQNGNADGGATYLRQLLQQFDGDIPRTLAAYNAGPAAVIRYGGVPPYPETQKYVAAILDHLADVSLTQTSFGGLQ